MDEYEGMDGMDMMEGQYGMEMDEGDMMDMDEGDMMDDMDEDGGGGFGEDESLNFDDNPEYAHMTPLDRMRKIRRTIIKTINDLREGIGSAPIRTDPNANKAASEYAMYLLENEQENQDKLLEICKNNQVVGDVIPLVGYALLEEEEDHQGTLHDQMLDAHGLLLELEETSQILQDNANNHIGIGFAFSKEKVKVVELIAEKTLCIHTLQQSEDQGIEARGTMLNREVGIYAASIVATSKLDKDIKAVDPSNIQFNKETGDFIVQIPGPLEDLFYNEDMRYIKFFIRRAKIDQIQYGVQTGDRVNTKGFEVTYQLPLEYIPDPRIEIEDKIDAEREFREDQVKKMQEEKEVQIKQAERVARIAEREKRVQAFQEKNADGDDVSGGMSGDSKSRSKTPGKGADSQGEGSKDDDEDGSGDDDVSSGGSDDMDDEDSDESGIAQLPSQNEMRNDLIQAIQEELQERDNLQRENDEFQKQILAMDQHNYDNQGQSDVQMNEHKYLNTLANVHQVRINLKETQDRYNKMASELQAKLNEKQAKCSEIESQFKELKRSVAQNAVFSRTGKKIPKKTLEEWEESESLKDQEVHQYRLQNIALRNRLANKEKVLKKREQLADGLHLIDFEQLKIENQTLNEKIEERNEELQKLRKKITQTVVILSHTREKLQYVQEQNQIQNQKLEDLKEQLTSDKSEQSKLKKNKERLQKKNLKLKQQTGIVNKKELQEDFNDREKRIEVLQEKIKMLSNKHAMLQQIIEKANEIQMKKMGT